MRSSARLKGSRGVERVSSSTVFLSHFRPVSRLILKVGGRRPRTEIAEFDTCEVVERSGANVVFDRFRERFLQKAHTQKKRTRSCPRTFPWSRFVGRMSRDASPRCFHGGNLLRAFLASFPGSKHTKSRHPPSLPLAVLMN